MSAPFESLVRKLSEPASRLDAALLIARRWYALTLGNRAKEWRNRNKLVTLYIPNFTFNIWESTEPIPLRELMKKGYKKLARPKTDRL